jgi:hypothetical protein
MVFDCYATSGSGSGDSGKGDQCVVLKSKVGLRKSIPESILHLRFRPPQLTFGFQTLRFSDFQLSCFCVSSSCPAVIVFVFVRFQSRKADQVSLQTWLTQRFQRRPRRLRRATLLPSSAGELRLFSMRQCTLMSFRPCHLRRQRFFVSKCSTPKRALVLCHCFDMRTHLISFSFCSEGLQHSPRAV